MKPKEKTKLALETFDKLMTIIDRWKGLDLFDPTRTMNSPRMIRNFPFYRNATMFPFDKKYVGKGLPFFPVNYVMTSKGRFFKDDEMISVALIIETRKLSPKSRYNRIDEAIRNSDGKYGNINFLYTTTTYIKKLMTAHDKKYKKYCRLTVTEIVNRFYNDLDELTKKFQANHVNDGGFNLPGLIKYSRELGSPTSIGEVIMDIVEDILTDCNWQTDRNTFLAVEKFLHRMSQVEMLRKPKPESKKTKKSVDKFIPAKMLVTEKKKRNRQANWE